MLILAFLKLRFGADEVVTTLLLNFVVLLFVQMMLEGPMKDLMGLGWPQSEPIIDEAVLPQLITRMRLHVGLIVGLIAAFVLWLVMKKTVLGFEIRAVGEVVGLRGYLTADLSPGFGYAGIVVAMLTGLSPLGVIAAAFFVASVFVGADSMSRATGVSNYLADLIVALSLLCVLVGGFFMRFKVFIDRPHLHSSGEAD